MTKHPAESDSSLVVKRETSASREQVWAVMADGWTYSQWVVGNSRMRAVDPHWPSVGAKIHHSVGVWPMGKARITLRLFDVGGGGCRIEMAEVPVGAPMGWVPERLALIAASPRNRECTWRLAAIAERRGHADSK